MRAKVSSLAPAMWFRQNNQIVYSNVFNPSKEFIADLELYLDNSQWQEKKATTLKSRPGMLNFSTVGRNASPDMRKAYNRWDSTNLEREDIVAYISDVLSGSRSFYWRVNLGGYLSQRQEQRSGG